MRDAGTAAVTALGNRARSGMLVQRQFNKDG